MYLLFCAFLCFFVLFCKKVKKSKKKKRKTSPLLTFFLAFSTVQKSSLLFKSKFDQKVLKSTGKVKEMSCDKYSQVLSTCL